MGPIISIKKRAERQGRASVNSETNTYANPCEKFLTLIGKGRGPPKGRDELRTRGTRSSGIEQGDVYSNKGSMTPIRGSDCRKGRKEDKKGLTKR